MEPSNNNACDMFDDDNHTISQEYPEVFKN